MKTIWETKQAILIAIPLIAAYLIQEATNFSGTIMIAHLGRDVLAAFALSFAIYNTLAVFFFGTLDAVGILTAQNFGANKIANLNKIVIQGFAAVILLSLPIIIIMRLASKLLLLTKLDHNLILLADYYLTALSYAIIPLGFLVVMEQLLTGMSKTKLVLTISIIQVPFEIFACYIFVFGKLGLPKYGIAGIGYGLTTAFIIATITIIYFLTRNKIFSLAKPMTQLFAEGSVYVKKLLSIGIPIGIMQIIEVGLFLIIALLMGKLSNDELAAYQISRQYLLVGITIVFALAQTTTIRIGQAHGRNDNKAIKLSAYVNIVLGLIIALIIAITYLIYANYLINIDIDIHNPNYSSLVHYAKTFLLYAGILLLANALRLTITGALRGLADTRIPMLISLIVFCFIAIPSAYILAFPCHLNGIGLWLGLIIGIITSCIILGHRFSLKLADFKE